MSKPRISLIAAIGKNRELGKDNKLLWHIPEDMKRFKSLTKGHVVIMGRNTFESIGRPLPERINIVITHDLEYNPPECIIVHSFGEALDVAKKHLKNYSSSDPAKPESREVMNGNSSRQARTINTDEIFIIGGGQVYKQVLPYADKLYLTVVDGTFDADTFFPEYSDFTNVVYKRESKDSNYMYTFLDLEKG